MAQTLLGVAGDDRAWETVKAGRSEALPKRDDFIWNRAWRNLCPGLMLKTLEIILARN